MFGTFVVVVPNTVAGSPARSAVIKGARIMFERLHHEPHSCHPLEAWRVTRAYGARHYRTTTI